MTSPKANDDLSEVSDNTEAETVASLEASFSDWDKGQLIKYAVNITQTLADREAAVKKITSRYDAAQNWAMGLALIEEIGQNLASTLDLNEVLTRLLTRVYNAIDVEDGSILLSEEPSGDLVSQVVLGLLSARTSKPFRVPKGQGIAGQVALTGVPVISNEAGQDPRHFTKIDEDTGFHTRSILCVPILTHKKILGVLEVFNKKSGPFTKQDELLLSSMANYAGIAIENARLHQNVVEERDRVIRAQEEVSHKLQRDLHDGPTQLVAAIQMGLDFCLQALEHNELSIAKTEINSIYELARRASHQMRTLLFELRPLILETKGLAPAVEKFIERRQKEVENSTLHFVQASDRSDKKISRLEAKAEAALFAIIQEAINNAVKHAEAKDIAVRLHEENRQLLVVIWDNGKGFDVSNVLQEYEKRGSYGMVNLRERVAITAGEYTISSTPGKGTEIRIEVPLEIKRDNKGAANPE